MCGTLLMSLSLSCWCGRGIGCGLFIALVIVTFCKLSVTKTDTVENGALGCPVR